MLIVKLVSYKISLAIQDYNYNVVHCKGMENITTDVLSRQSIPTEFLETIADLVEMLDDLPNKQRSEEDLNRIIKIFNPTEHKGV